MSQTTTIACQQLYQLSAYLWSPAPSPLASRIVYNSHPDDELPKVQFLDSEHNSSIMQEMFTIFDDYDGTDRNF